MATLGTLAETAVQRYVAAGRKPGTLFNAQETQRLAAALAAVNGTAELLGRVRIREHQRRAFQQHDPQRHAELPPATSFFADNDPAQVPPLAPEKALAHFRALVPMLAVTPAWAPKVQRQAFTLAAATDQQILEKVQAAIAERLEQGNAASGPRAIADILDAAGVSPRNPQYAEMVFRTNMMEEYNAGADQERQDPDVADTFPVWRFDGPHDERERPSHAVHNGRYFPNDVDFAEVRDSVDGEYSGYNCRHTSVPIDKWTWAELQAAGAEVSTFAEQFCGGPGSGKPGPCPTGGAPPDAPSAGWLARAKQLPRQVLDKAVAKVKEKYTQLENRYGRKYAVAIMGAGLAGVPVPMPGASLIMAAPVIAVAELHRRFSLSRHDEAAGPTLTPAQIEALGWRWIAELQAEWQPEGERFCGGPGSGVPGPCPQGGQAADPAANRPSKPEERHPDATPPILPFEPPPPPRGQKGGGQIVRPKGELSQVKQGDRIEAMTEQLGFRNILPEGQRHGKSVALEGSTLDREYDHSGKAFEVKECKVTATEYRAKVKLEEKEGKQRYAENHQLEPHVMIAVHDPEARTVHYYWHKEPGITGKAVNAKDWNFAGKVSY